MGGDRAEAREAIIIASVHASRVSRELVPALALLQELGLRILAVHPLADLQGVAEIVDVARQRGVKLVVTAGGDGTVGTAVNCMAGTGMTLGVLPLGTSNDFARGLGIPGCLREACAVVAHGKARHVDLGRMVTDEGIRAYFVHGAVVGMNSQFARLVTTVGWRKRFGRFAYPVAAASVLRNRRALAVHIVEDGKHLRGRVLQVSVLNSPIFGGAFGGLRVPEATLTDRRLDLLVLGDVEPRRLLHVLRVIVGHKVRRVPYTYLAHPKQVRIETEEPRDISCDGELIGKTPVTITCVPRVLEVLG